MWISYSSHHFNVLKTYNFPVHPPCSVWTSSIGSASRCFAEQIFNSRVATRSSRSLSMSIFMVFSKR